MKAKHGKPKPAHLPIPKDRWRLTIERIDDAYLLTGKFGDSLTLTQDLVQSDDRSKLRSAIIMLYEVLEYFGIFGGKHDPERINIELQQRAGDSDHWITKVSD